MDASNGLPWAPVCSLSNQGTIFQVTLGWVWGEVIPVLQYELPLRSHYAVLSVVEKTARVLLQSFLWVQGPETAKNKLCSA